MKAIVIAAHGSRDPRSSQQLIQLIALIRQQSSVPVWYGFLEFNEPTIKEAVTQAKEAGATEIIMLPSMLLAATHTKNDLPAELRVLREEFPEIQFHAAGTLDLHPLLLERCREKLITVTPQWNRAQTVLLVVGRGTTDPDANADILKLARFLEEGMGWEASMVCYSGTAEPDLKTGLARAATLANTLGAQAGVVVLPYLLFEGILSERVKQATEAAAVRYPHIQFAYADVLGVDEKVAQVFLERAEAGILGTGHMNCSLCKYRTAVIGYESEQGAPQVGHHGGIRGITEPTRETSTPTIEPYVPHPIEAESFRIIETLHDWETIPSEWRYAAQRLVHTAGDPDIVSDLFFSAGAIEAGVMAAVRGLTIVTDVTMVQTGLKRELLNRLSLTTWCGVHDPETHLLAKELGMTRSAVGIRRAYERFGNDCVVLIGDAPTAITEAVRLIHEQHWRPGLVVGLPVGFVGTAESKESLKKCLRVPRVTNTGFRGGSPWASSVMNACLIEANNRLAQV